MLTVDGETGATEIRDGPVPPPPRVLGPARRVPGTRAVLGGFLVATAAVATFGAYIEATTSHKTGYLVAARALAPGQRLSPGDVRIEKMTLPGETTSEAFSSPAQVTGAVLIAPLRPGELVQAGDLSRSAAASWPRQLSFSVDPSRAVDGSLQIGDRVDLLATFGSGSAATTTVVASNLVVLAKHDENESFSTPSTSGEVLTVGIDASNDPLGIVQAVNTGQIVVVRTTGATGTGGQ